MSDQNSPLPKEKRVWWTIDISGYGKFAHYGTEAEAEQMRKDKAEWEGGRGSKRPASPIEVHSEQTHLKWKLDNEYPLDERELEALRS